MNWYQEHLLDHYRNPRHKGTLTAPTFSSGEYNPSCGDQVSFQGIVREGILVEVAFEGAGCVISQAAASMLAELVTGKSVAVINAMSADDMLKLVGMELGPTRLRCALISLEALKKGISG